MPLIGIKTSLLLFKWKLFNVFDQKWARQWKDVCDVGGLRSPSKGKRAQPSLLLEDPSHWDGYLPVSAVSAIHKRFQSRKPAVKGT